MVKSQYNGPPQFYKIDKSSSVEVLEARIQWHKYCTEILQRWLTEKKTSN